MTAWTCDWHLKCVCVCVCVLGSLVGPTPRPVGAPAISKQTVSDLSCTEGHLQSGALRAWWCGVTPHLYTPLQNWCQNTAAQDILVAPWENTRRLALWQGLCFFVQLLCFRAHSER